MKFFSKKEKPVISYVHPVSAIIHNKIKKIIESFPQEISSVLDIGGTDKLNGILRINVINANIISGIDGMNLPYDDNAYDATVSIATLEHVSDQKKFIEEAIRVSKKVSIHWFPMGKDAMKVEKIKKDLGHHHPCNLPDYDYIFNIPGIIMIPYINCREHLLLLSTLKQEYSSQLWFDSADLFSSNENYGYLAIISKNNNA